MPPPPVSSNQRGALKEIWTPEFRQTANFLCSISNPFELNQRSEPTIHDFFLTSLHEIKGSPGTKMSASYAQTHMKSGKIIRSH